MKTVPTLYTDRCMLSEVIQKDIPVLRQIMDDAETKKFLPELCQEFQTQESLYQFIASFDIYLKQDDGVLWGIHKNEVLIGFIAIMDITATPTLFYAMHADCRNRGYMKEAIITTLQFTKEVDLCRIIQTEVYCDNVISDRLLTNLNFKWYKQEDKKVYYVINLNKINNSYNNQSK